MAPEKDIQRLIALTRSLMRQWEAGPAVWLQRLADPLPRSLTDDAAASVRELERIAAFDPFADLTGFVADPAGDRRAAGRPGARRRLVAPDRSIRDRHGQPEVVALRPGLPAPGGIGAAPDASRRRTGTEPPPHATALSARPASTTPESGSANADAGTAKKITHAVAERSAAEAPEAKGAPPGRHPLARTTKPPPSAVEQLESRRRAWARQRLAPVQPATPAAARAPLEAGTADAASGNRARPVSLPPAAGEHAAPPRVSIAATPGGRRAPTLATRGESPRDGGGAPAPVAGADRSGPAASRRVALTIEPLEAGLIIPPAPAPAALSVPDDDLALQLADSAYLHGIDQT